MRIPLQDAQAQRAVADAELEAAQSEVVNRLRKHDRSKHHNHQSRPLIMNTKKTETTDSMTDAEFNALYDMSAHAGTAHTEALLDVLFERPEYDPQAVADGALAAVVRAWIDARGLDANTKRDLLDHVQGWTEIHCARLRSETAPDGLDDPHQLKIQ